MLALRGLVLSCALFVFPTRALAEGPATAVLRVDRSRQASGCPDGRALARRVNAVAHREAIVARGGDVVLRVGIDHSKAGFTASLAAEGARSGERDLEDEGTSCDGLTEALAVSIALLLDEDEPPPPPSPPPRVRILEPRPLPDAPSPGRGHGPPLPSMAIDVLAVESAGLVGSSTFGVEGNADFRVSQLFTFGGGVFAMIDDTQRFGAGTLHLNLVAVRANACLTFRVADQSIGGALCGFPALGSMLATARGFDENQTASQPWFALGAGAVADGPIIGPLGFETRLDLVVPVVRPRFVVEDLGGAGPGQAGTAFKASALGLAIGIGVRVLIP